MTAAPIFAHLHSSPLVVRRRNGSDWQSLSNQAPSIAASPLPFAGLSSSGLEPVDIIDVKEERKLLVQCLQEAKKRIVWHSEVADLHTFRKVLSFGCRVLHFSGHGVPGKVIFENKNCEAQFISQQELKDLLLAGGMEHRESAEDRDAELKPPSLSNSPRRALNAPSRLRSMLFRRGAAAAAAASKSVDGILGGGYEEEGEEIQTTETERGWISLHPPPRVPVKLVFLSACHSESVAEAFVTAGVSHVVVVSKDDKILDKKAMEFSKAFYTALFAGHSVARAFEIGQVQANISITSDGGNSKFKLLGHGDHSEPLFRDADDGQFIENSLPPPVNDCDSVAEVFVGRSLEVHQVFKSLVDGARLVSITGDRGIGKTEIALQCAQYATERRVYKHIYFARLEESTPSGHPTHNCPTALIAQAFGSLAQTELELANSVRQLCVGGSFLLILDGCNKRTRRDPTFRAVIAQLLRRVNDLSILIIGDGKIGAMDGVGEKIIRVDHLPPADAALLFTLRAPRRLKAHEMGGTSDLLVFAEHPIIRNLMGHPRSICAVAQFLENKDMELDKHEFLNYIIPSVVAGLASEKSMDDVTCLSASVIGSLSHCYDSSPALPHSHNHHHHHHHHPATPGHHHHHHERWSSMSSIPIQLPSSDEDALDLAVSLESTKLESTRSDPGSVDDSIISSQRPQLEPSQSEPHLGATGPYATSTSAPSDFYILKIMDSLKHTVADEEGRAVWANAVVSNSLLPSHEAGSVSVMQRLDSIRSVPIDWLAPFISRYFATKLKADAAKRPLSIRSIDFLTKSTLVWGSDGRSPAQLNGQVDVEMFAHFWRWFGPITGCIALSRLWSYTQPRLLHGFLSKGECVTMLQRAPVGTFLIRFSETRLRCFVIVYVTDQQNVQFVPVECHQKESSDDTSLGGDGTWYVSLQEDRIGATFATVQDLVLSVTVLKYLFPQTPKEIAFAC